MLQYDVPQTRRQTPKELSIPEREKCLKMPKRKQPTTPSSSL